MTIAKMNNNAMNGVLPENKKVLLVSIQQTIMATLTMLSERGSQVACKKIFQVTFTYVDTFTSSLSSLICVGFNCVFGPLEISFARGRNVCIRLLLGIYIENIGVASLLHKYWFTLLTLDTQILLSPFFF